jgi:hypothetical protein
LTFQAALRGEDSLRTIANTWSISKSTLIRHRADHLPAATLPSAPAGTERIPNHPPEPSTPLAASSNPWDKLADESGPAHVAFLIYRDLGAARTLNAAYHAHLRSQGQGGPDRGQAEAKAGASGPGNGPPPRVSGRWRTWAEAFRWTERAEAYDRHFAAIRLAEQERVTKTFTAEYAGARELLLAGLLKLQINYLKGSQAESKKGGKLIERVIRRVGRDANGGPVQSEETFSAIEQIETLLMLDKFLRGEVGTSAEPSQDGSGAPR